MFCLQFHRVRSKPFRLGEIIPIYRSLLPQDYPSKGRISSLFSLHLVRVRVCIRTWNALESGAGLNGRARFSSYLNALFLPPRSSLTVILVPSATEFRRLSFSFYARLFSLPLSYSSVFVTFSRCFRRANALSIKITPIVLIVSMAIVDKRIDPLHRYILCTLDQNLEHFVRFNVSLAFNRMVETYAYSSRCAQ